jgi:SOS response regulatory protein OraA/RecX
VSDIKKRMAHVRGQRRKAFDGPDRHGTIFCYVWGDDASEAALEEAKKYFGTENDRTLALVMAEVLFGRGGRGRAKGTKTWTDAAYWALARAIEDILFKDVRVSEQLMKKITETFPDADPEELHIQPLQMLRSKAPVPKISDSEIARQLINSGKYKGYDVGSLRQRIAETKRVIRQYSIDMAAEEAIEQSKVERVAARRRGELHK